MSFRDYATRLVGEVPRLPLSLAKQLVNDARRQIYAAHDWSFLHAEGYLPLPAQVSTGTLNVTRSSTSVVPSSGAKTIFDNFESTYGVPLTECSIKVGALPPLPVASYDSSGSGLLTLERAYPESSNSSSPYLLFRNLITPPPTLLGTDSKGDDFLDFRRFLLVKDAELEHVIFDARRPMASQAELNRADPQRTATGNPYRLAPYDVRPQLLDESGAVLRRGSLIPRFELWPRPTSERPLYCIYLRRGADFIADGDILPSIIPQSLLLSLARTLAYEWADAHKGEHRELLPVNWQAKIRILMSSGSAYSPNEMSYPRQLARAVQEDRALMQTGWLSNYYSRLAYSPTFPGGDYARTHGIAGI